MSIRPIQNKVITSDSLEYLKLFNDYQADILFCDPPYALGSEIIIRQDGKVDYKKASDFMNKWEMPTGEYWEKWFIEAYRTLKYGGYLIMYGMDRQLLLFKYYASLAGFQEQQSIYWYYISNFPKATDLSKMIDKRGGGNFDTNHIAAAIKEARLKRKMTVSECDKLFCDSSTNWTWFEGRKAGVRPPTYDTFMKIANEWNELLPLAEAVKEAEREIKGKLKTNISLYKEIGNGSESGEINITKPSTDLAKKYEGYKYSISPLKQTCETIMVFKKPNKTGSVLHDTLAMENGDDTITCSALNIDGNRVDYDMTDTNPATNPRYRFENGYKIPEKGQKSNGTSNFTSSKNDINLDGRYPSQTFVDSQVAEKLDLQSGVNQTQGKSYNYTGVKEYDEKGFISNIKPNSPSNYGDTGGCSKILHKCDYEKFDFDLFIYNPKVSKQERNKGLDNMEDKVFNRMREDKGEPTGLNKEGRFAPTIAKNNHPTLKPIELNKKILKLFKTPNEQVIIYPFAGSGSEIIGGHKANFRNWFACEINDNYTKIANARIKHFEKNDYEQLSLFDE